MSEKLRSRLLSELNNGNHEVALKRSIDHALSSTYKSDLNGIVRKLADLLNNRESVDLIELNIHEYLNITQKFEEPMRFEHSELVLKANGISKQYAVGSFQFKSISFELKAGSLTGVVGRNGNGKTTLLSMLSGDLLASTGFIEYPLIAAKNQDPYTIKQHIGYIPQRIPAWFGVLEDNLKFALATLGFHPEEIEFRVEIMLKRLGLYEYRQYTWSQISGGYRTRFELAKVLLKRPSILVLDEPLANLDVKAQQTFLQDLKYMAMTEGHPMAVILSSQLLHEVEQVSDDLFFIKDGHCLYQSSSTPNNLETIIIEFISSNPFEDIKKIANSLNGDLKAENNFYTLTTSKILSAKILLKRILDADIDIQYYRDITNSTKRLF